jgi:DNA topoisomerase-1
MGKKLVICESPGKIKKIQSFLGKDYVVKASIGHIRELKKGKEGIDKKNDFEPSYQISSDKKDVVKELKDLAKKCDEVILAGDYDLEGEAISWHVAEVLGLNIKKTKRIIFKEITEKAINEAINNPTTLNMNMVNAQQARRVLDRLVGFDLSPLLWKKIKLGLSAGRVQSVALRILVEREKEHKSFDSTSNYKVVAIFSIDKGGKKQKIKAVLNKRFKNFEETEKFLNKLVGSEFSVSLIETKPGKRSSPAPFTTSSLQQEASKKFGFSVDRTMRTAQNLYEQGHISYHRTDSVNLSEESVQVATEFIVEKYGNKFSNPKKFKNKNASAQEAHEAIRPTHFEHEEVVSGQDEMKLYSLIWKRAVASQMSDALLDKTTIEIESSNTGKKELFVAKGEVITFDGFLKVYNNDDVEEEENQENQDENGTLPKMEKGQILNYEQIDGLEIYSKPSARYNEASLVKRLEELGIGRPSTYASILSTIQKREYVEKKDLPAKSRKVKNLSLKNDNLSTTELDEKFGTEKAKMIPTEIGIVVCDYLTDNFPDIMDYKFTAGIENQLDEISEGNKEWKTMLKDFYSPFDKKVKSALGETGTSNERLIGVDKSTKKNVYARFGRFGPMVQLGEKGDEDLKYASIPKDKEVGGITLEEALELLKWPRNLGEYKSKPVQVAIGKFGPYIKYDGKFVGLSNTEYDPEKITLKEASELIKENSSNEKSGSTKEFGEIKVLSGQYGPYIKFKNKNYKIPAIYDIETITKKDCEDIIGEGKSSAKPKKYAKKK